MILTRLKEDSNQPTFDLPATVRRPDYVKESGLTAGRGRGKLPACFLIRPGHVTVKALKKLKVECPCEWHAARDGKGFVRYLDYVLEEAVRKADRLAAVRGQQTSAGAAR